MSLFGALPIARSGMEVDQVWLDTIGGNVANANDQATPGTPVYRPEYVEATPNLSGGVQVGAITLGSPTGVLQYDPASPRANAQGYVAVPAVDMASEMVGLVAAQSSYQANAAVARDALEAYKSVLSIRS